MFIYCFVFDWICTHCIVNNIAKLLYLFATDNDIEENTLKKDSNDDNGIKDDSKTKTSKNGKSATNMQGI